MNDKSTGGHEANKDSVPLIGCTDMGVSKDFGFSKKMNYKKTRVTAKKFGNSDSQKIWRMSETSLRVTALILVLRIPKKNKLFCV